MSNPAVEMPDATNCYRCGQPGHVRWIDTTSLGSAFAPTQTPAESYCLTEGCTDLDGSRRLVALTPNEMRARADEAWMARQLELIEPPVNGWTRWFMRDWVRTGGGHLMTSNRSGARLIEEPAAANGASSGPTSPSGSRTSGPRGGQPRVLVPPDFIAARRPPSG